MVTGEQKTWESIKEGLRFVVHTKEVLGALALDLFAVLFGGAVALIPVYARDILRIGPIGFGWLNAADDIGSIIVIGSLTLRPLKHRQGYTLLYAVFGFGVSIIVFGLSKLYFLSFAALLCSGMLDGISVVIRGTIVQLKTPDPMRGRVSSVNSMFINSSNELGQFESGVMAKLLGVVPSVVFGGCMTIAVVLATWFKAPSLRELEY
jgi:predicted MFS family arabinose efflux permease